MEQATGLERFELLGRMEGVDVFDMRPLEMDRIGTVQDPWPIYSLVSCPAACRPAADRD